MGQKTEFDPDEWDILEEDETDQQTPDTSISVKIKNDFSASDWDKELLDLNEESSAVFNEKPSAAFNEKPSISTDKSLDKIKEFLESTSEPLISEDNNSTKDKVYISYSKSGKPISEQEEDAFRKQIEDLFELLELEKSSAKSDGVRVYQTDSSPSRPWRFH